MISKHWTQRKCPGIMYLSVWKKTTKKNNKDGVKNVSYLPIRFDKTDSIGVHKSGFQYHNHTFLSTLSFLSPICKIPDPLWTLSQWVEFYSQDDSSCWVKRLLRHLLRPGVGGLVPLLFQLFKQHVQLTPGLCLNPRSQWNFEGKPSLLVPDF